MLFNLSRRLRWEKLHYEAQSVRPTGRNKWLCTEKSLVKLFSPSLVHLSSNTTSILEREFDWWDNFFDLVRYKRHHGDFDIHPGRGWYSDELSQWLKSQVDSFHDLLSRVTDEDAPAFSERHFQAFMDIGFSFYQENNLTTIDLLTTRLGRRPVILGLEADFLKDIVRMRRTGKSRLGKIRDIVTDHSWLSRFHDLKGHLINANCSLSSAFLEDTLNAGRLPRPLLDWVHHQLDQYRRYIYGQKSSLTHKRINLLESIGLNMIGNDHEDWALNIDLLQAFKRKYGHCFVPPSWHDQRLGRWIHKVRHIFRAIGAKSKTDSSFLTSDRIKELFTLGVDLNLDDYAWAVLSFEEMFNARLLELRDFQAKYGHCDVPVDYTSPHFELSLWVREQRILLKGDSEGMMRLLDLSKIQMLKDLPNPKEKI
jgi:hypothetical protein